MQQSGIQQNKRGSYLKQDTYIAQAKAPAELKDDLRSGMAVLLNYLLKWSNFFALGMIRRPGFTVQRDERVDS